MHGIAFCLDVLGIVASCKDWGERKLKESTVKVLR